MTQFNLESPTAKVQTVLTAPLANHPTDEISVDQAGRPAVFTAKDLSKTYQMGEVKVHALVDVDLTIYRGEFIVLLGPSGSGKSTLLNILGGLDRPTSGIARFAEHDLTAATESQLTQYRREHVGFVFQFYNLIPSLTVRENVELVTALFPVGARSALFVLDKGHARLQEIEVAARNGVEAWVKSGLTPGTQVIVYPDTKLKDGDRVKAR